MIKVNSDKTEGMRRRGIKNREKVKAWFEDNPGETVAECARSLGFTWVTVKRHIVDIQSKERVNENA
jgi:phage FluMu gp28-like protein